MDSELIIVNGVKIEISRIKSTRDKRSTLVFLHEGLGCISMWKDFPYQLSEKTGMGAVIYSRVGYGNSDSVKLPRSLNYMNDEALTFLPQLLAIERIDRAILIGHSDGGSIALICAGSEVTNRIQAIFSIAPHVFNEASIVDMVGRVKSDYQKRHLRKRLKHHHGKNVDNAFWGWCNVWLDPQFFKWNIEKYLPQISVPVMVVQGAEDQFGSMDQVKAIIKSVGARTGVRIIEGSGHSPHLEKTEEVLQIAFKFIKGLNSSGPST